MKKLSTLVTSVILAFGLSGVGTVASAKSADANKVTAVVQSTVTIEQAIAVAQQNFNGELSSIEFDYDDTTRKGVYEIKLVSTTTKMELKVDANTGNVLEHKQERLDRDDKVKYDRLKQSTISLSDAIKRAKQRGHVIEAEFDIENGQAVYEIEVLQGQQKRKVVINTMTGQFIRN
ncbi:PepSY domain-containing protein [Psychrobacter sp. I-STPA6b]|uniref:PepSY domain-containing protein n=1 Tax=Psychrobacter sp. I-STPA6b TaxID=2585718 RepID=UPI001D0C13C9|nr:PepSY domain-containing protein [Psychrobacter sp. I-STPA6b]